MRFHLEDTLQRLSHTPSTLKDLLEGLGDEWLHSNEGEATWSPYQVLGHLIHCERTDWVPRARIILRDGEGRTFDPVNRFAMLERDRRLDNLTSDFAKLRDQNLKEVRSWNLSEEDLEKRGQHPEFGPVTLRQLLATWLVHDWNHLGQISRVLAHQYEEEVGPWKAYLGILNQ